MGLGLRELLPMGDCEVRQESSEEMSTWQMRPLRFRLTIRTQGPGISPPKLLPGPCLMYVSCIYRRAWAHTLEEPGGHLLSLSPYPPGALSGRDIPASYHCPPRSLLLLLPSQARAGCSSEVAAFGTRPFLFIPYSPKCLEGVFSEVRTAPGRSGGTGPGQKSALEANYLRSELQRPAKPMVGAKGCFADLRASLALIVADTPNFACL